MKLFKKLAAAMLAAALALTMVGCGAGGTGSAIDLKNEVLNVIEDSYCADQYERQDCDPHDCHGYGSGCAH